MKIKKITMTTYKCLALVCVFFSLTFYPNQSIASAEFIEPNILNQAVAKLNQLLIKFRGTDAIAHQYLKGSSDAKQRSSSIDAIIQYRLNDITQLFNQFLNIKQVNYKSDQFNALEKLHTVLYQWTKNNKRFEQENDAQLKQSEEMIALARSIIKDATEKLTFNQNKDKLVILIDRLAKQLDTIHADNIETKEAEESLAQAQKTFGDIETLLHENKYLQSYILSEEGKKFFAQSIHTLDLLNDHIKYEVIADVDEWIDIRREKLPAMSKDTVIGVCAKNLQLADAWKSMHTVFIKYGLMR